MSDIIYHPIGIIRTPYDESFAPNQPVEKKGAEARLELDPGLEEALSDLSGFSYVYVLFHMDRQTGEIENRVRPPWAHGAQVGLFASRSPARPNPIGLSVVRLLRVEGSTIVTSSIDTYDMTPILDIKPYIRGLDSKDDANVGWIASIEGGGAHVLEHLRGIPHDHDHDHHDHDHHDHDRHEH